MNFQVILSLCLHLDWSNYLDPTIWLELRLKTPMLIAIQKNKQHLLLRPYSYEVKFSCGDTNFAKSFSWNFFAIPLKGLCDCFSSLRSQNIIQCQRKRFLRYEFESMTMRVFTMCLFRINVRKITQQNVLFYVCRIGILKNMRLVNYINYIYQNIITSVW